VFACNKNKALQTARIPIVGTVGYNIGSVAASG